MPALVVVMVVLMPQGWLPTASGPMTTTTQGRHQHYPGICCPVA
jgi:hypothetical protein